MCSEDCGSHLLLCAVNLRSRLLSAVRQANSSIVKGPAPATYWNMWSSCSP